MNVIYFTYRTEYNSFVLFIYNNIIANNYIDYFGFEEVNKILDWAIFYDVVYPLIITKLRYIVMEIIIVDFF